MLFGSEATDPGRGIGNANRTILLLSLRGPALGLLLVGHRNLGERQNGCSRGSKDELPSVRALLLVDYIVDLVGRHHYTARSGGGGGGGELGEVSG